MCGLAVVTSRGSIEKLGDVAQGILGVNREAGGLYGPHGVPDDAAWLD